MSTASKFAVPPIVNPPAIVTLSEVSRVIVEPPSDALIILEAN